jgi:hypothetical protein
MLTHIESAAVCIIDAARSQYCLRVRALQLREPILDAFTRATLHWADKNYHRRPEQSAPFASALLRASIDDDGKLLLELAEKLSKSPASLSDFLGTLLIVATYEVAFVPQLAGVWPTLMAIGLGTLRDHTKDANRHSVASLLDNLMPSPSTIGYFDNPDSVLATATANWFPMESVSAHVGEWLKHARGQMQGIDALVGFLKTRPALEQIHPGLEWVDAIVIDEDGAAITCGFLLVGWLRALRDAYLGDADRRTHRKITDALALGNFKGARELQRLEE